MHHLLAGPSVPIALIAFLLLSPGCKNNEPDTDPDPGRVTLHRLNKAEYNNTVRDLLGTSLTPADDFPDDDFGHGFDNIAETLTLSPLHLEMYERAATQLIDEALHIPIAEPITWQFEAEDANASTGGSTGGGTAWNLWSNGTLGATFTAPEDNRYRITTRCFGQQAGPDLVQMAMLVDGIAVDTIEVDATAGNWSTYATETTINEGLHLVEIAFLNDYYNPPTEDRNLVVDWFEVEGPLDITQPTNPLREALLTCDPADIGNDACGREILGRFAFRAWRRPLEDGELDALMAFITDAEQMGEGFEEGLRSALIASLVSPHFIFRVEIDQQPETREPFELRPYELASRMSYFLWSSMPDDELFALAEDASLSDPAVLIEQTFRMLDDSKSTALTDNFAGNWLYIRSLDDAAPDPWYFGDWSQELREAMGTEMRLQFDRIIREDLSMLELINGEQTFVNEILALHYGIPGINGPEFQQVSLQGTGRRGFLTTGGLLTSLSYPARTSPVRRGKWVLGQLLCSEPAPPPPGVEGLEESEGEGETLRQTLARHRQDPSCAICHDTMDNIGLAMEQFDGIGAWRDQDNGIDIDATGALPDGRSFDGAAELSEVLAEHEDLADCITRTTFMYALGRGLMGGDRDYLDAINAEFVASGHSFSDLAATIVSSKPFRMRRGEDR